MNRPINLSLWSAWGFLLGAVIGAGLLAGGWTFFHLHQESIGQGMEEYVAGLVALALGVGGAAVGGTLGAFLGDRIAAHRLTAQERRRTHPGPGRGR